MDSGLGGTTVRWGVEMIINFGGERERLKFM